MKNIEEAKNETETRPFSFGMYWQVYGTQTVNVPIHLNEKEALDRYEEIDNSTDCVENRISKNFSFEFDKWVYTITYKTIKYSDNSLKEGRD